MLFLQLLDLAEALRFKVGEVPLPVHIELVQLLVSDLNILCQLLLLDVLSQLVLIVNNVLLQLSHLTHQVLEHLVLKDIAEFTSEELHLGLDEGEDEYLLVFVKEAITIHIENVHEISSGLDTKEVVDDLFVLLKY